jgi:hypothetical protein
MRSLLTGYTPRIVKSTDGRVWFADLENLLSMGSDIHSYPFTLIFLPNRATMTFRYNVPECGFQDAVKGGLSKSYAELSTEN